MLQEKLKHFSEDSEKVVNSLTQILKTYNFELATEEILENIKRDFIYVFMDYKIFDLYFTLNYNNESKSVDLVPEDLKTFLIFNALFRQN